MASKTTQKDRLLNVFEYQYDDSLSTAQLARRINAPRPSVRRLIGELRMAGYPILRENITRKGKTTARYFLGTATSNMVAAAALFGGPRLFYAENA